MHKMIKYALIILTILLLMSCTKGNKYLLKSDFQEHNYAGYFVKTDTDKFDPIIFINNVYGEIDSVKNQYYNNFPYRDRKGIRISYFDAGVFIGDHGGCDIVTNSQSELQSKIQEYFNYPELIFAVMAYESGGSAGYRLIRKRNPSHAVFTIESDYTFRVEGVMTDIDREILGNRRFSYPDYSRVWLITENMTIELFNIDVMDERTALKNQYFVLKNGQ